MHFVDKPFRCYSDLPLDLCKQRIEREFRELSSFRLLSLHATLSEKDNGFTIQIELPYLRRIDFPAFIRCFPVFIRDFPAFIIVEAEVIPHQSNIQMKGHATFTNYILRYFVIFALPGLLVVPLIFVKWWLILWIVGWFGTLIGYTRYFWKTRNELIQTLCNTLR